MKKRILGLLLATTAAIGLASCDNENGNDAAVITYKDANGSVITTEDKPTNDADTVAAAFASMLSNVANVNVEDAFSSVFETATLKLDLDLTTKSLDSEIPSMDMQIAGDVKVDLGFKFDEAKLDGLPATAKLSDAFSALGFYLSIDVDGSAKVDEETYAIDGVATAFSQDAKIYGKYEFDKFEIPGLEFDNANKCFIDLEEIIDELDFNFPLSMVLGVVETVEASSEELEVPMEEIKEIVDAFGITISKIDGTKFTFSFAPNETKLAPFLTDFFADLEEEEDIEFPANFASVLATAATKMVANITIDISNLRIYEFNLDLGDAVKYVCDSFANAAEIALPTMNKSVIKISSTCDYSARELPTYDTADSADLTESALGFIELLLSFLGDGYQPVIPF